MDRLFEECLASVRASATSHTVGFEETKHNWRITTGATTPARGTPSSTPCGTEEPPEGQSDRHPGRA